MAVSNHLNHCLKLLDTIDTKTQSLVMGENNQAAVEKNFFAIQVVRFIKWCIRQITCGHFVVNPKLDALTRDILKIASDEEKKLNFSERERLLTNLKKLTVIVKKNYGSGIDKLKNVIKKIEGVQKLNKKSDTQGKIEDIPELEKLTRDDPADNKKLEQLAMLCEHGIDKDPSLAHKAVKYSIELAERLLKETRDLEASQHYMRALKICGKQADLKEKVKTLEETIAPLCDKILNHYFMLFNTKKTLSEIRQEHDEALKVIKNILENIFFDMTQTIEPRRILTAAAFADTFPDLYEEENPFVPDVEELYKRSLEAWEKEILISLEEFWKKKKNNPTIFLI